MNTALIVIHYMGCTILFALILLQAGKGADMGAAFGGASQTVFGGRGPATFLSKMTTFVAILFLITSISLAQLSKKATVKSVIDTAAEVTAPAPAAVPAAPDAGATSEETTAAPDEKK
ncbi:MAG: preprotein translocase subunit SecG [Deltaproteobacteria bacterium]|nr:preprotein translocase subunit SecG [Deltaproteobacteria bacterium]